MSAVAHVHHIAPLEAGAHQGRVPEDLQPRIETLRRGGVVYMGAVLHLPFPLTYLKSREAHLADRVRAVFDQVGQRPRGDVCRTRTCVEYTAINGTVVVGGGVEAKVPFPHTLTGCAERAASRQGQPCRQYSAIRLPARPPAH